MYCQMIIMLIYLPCNMQIFQSRAALMGMIMLIILYANRKLLRRQFNIIIYNENN